jgi:hypothetical protein
MPNASFEVARALKNQSGYLLLANRYTTERTNYIIKTDTALQSVWTRKINFPQGPVPFDNVFFYDIGELLSGNYYLMGEATDATQQIVWYSLFVLDTNGIVLFQNTVRETNHLANAANVPKVHIGLDSSLILVTSEYEWMGFYRFDQQLNLLSSGFYQLALNTNTWGNDCIMLSDSNLLLTGGPFTLTKTTRQGNIIWSKGDNGLGRIFSLYEAPDKSIYAGGSNGLPFLARLDSSGNLLWCKQYNTTPAINGSSTYAVYPLTNGNLLVYTDSVMFEADTLGTPVGFGFAQQKYNYGELRAAGLSDFTLCGMFYQSAASNYMPTIMRFQTLSGSECLFVRTIIASNLSSTVLNPTPQVMTQNILQQNPVYSDSLVVFGFDPLPGCPLGPLAITEYEKANSNISVFPNPATDVISFQSTADKVSVEVLDVSGRVVFSGIPKRNDNYTFSISVGELPAGVYALQVYSNGEIKSHSIFCVQNNR